jgi:hypothetical protein
VANLKPEGDQRRITGKRALMEGSSHKFCTKDHHLSVAIDASDYPRKLPQFAPNLP